jgi:hypothetical protein
MVFGNLRLALAPVAVLSGGLFLALSASATVVGTLGTGTSGSITVTNTSLFFNLDPIALGGGTANSDVTNATALSFVGCPPPGTAGTAGCLPVADGITINNADLTSTPPSLANQNTFLTFNGFPNLVFSETQIGPGSSNTNCAAANANGLSCSVFAGSPIILTFSNGSSFVGLSVSGKASDTGVGGLPGGTNYTGGFTEFIAGQTPLQLQNFFCPGGVCGSASLTVNNVAGSFVASTVPEPDTAFLSSLGIVMLLVGARFRKSHGTRI